MKLRTDEISEEEAKAHMEAVKADPLSNYEGDCPLCVAAWKLGLWETP